VTANKISYLFYEFLMLSSHRHNTIKHETNVNVADIRVCRLKRTARLPEKLPLGFNWALTSTGSYCCSGLIHCHFYANGSTGHCEHEIWSLAGSNVIVIWCYADSCQKLIKYSALRFFLSWPGHLSCLSKHM